ncbi:type VI secretion system protein TssA [Variovorax sp. Varisp62]|uniref:type VI secretion system protein TssA n=1 Tax=Variovorax sp. Varisp62 TaxID=3243049 RepID=UPI0039B55542
MLTNELAATLLAPIGEASPCGDDLEYDADFMALVAAAQGKPEQQFGDTVIPAVEPEWREVGEQAGSILRRSKDVRAAVLLLRASTHLQGVPGFVAGLQLLTGLLDTFWEGIHPKLDADDDNDPTMRLNALAPFCDESQTMLRELYDAQVGVAPGVGPIRVRDIAVAHNALGAVSGEATYSASQVKGGLEAIHASQPEPLRTAMDVPAHLEKLRALLVDRTGRADAIDLTPLRTVAQVLKKACGAAAGTPDEAPASADAEADESQAAGTTARSTVMRGEIQNRQDALQMLDRVIRYLEQAEPGNPAPLLIERAKKLIGVSFLEIMANLAPNAMDTIETVTGRRPSE